MADQPMTKRVFDKIAEALREAIAIARGGKQPDPSTGFRFTEYKIRHKHAIWPIVEHGFIYHKIDLSDLAEPYLSAVKKTLLARKPRGSTHDRR